MSALLSVEARADAKPRVILVSPTEGDRVVARMRDELTLVGLDVEIVAADSVGGTGAGMGNGKPDELLARYGAVAIAVVGDTGQSQSDRVILRVPARYLSNNESDATMEVVGTGKDSDLLALRAVELLRGKLLPVERLEAAVRAPPETPAASAPPVSSTAAPANESPPKETSPKRVSPARDVRPPRLRLYLAPALVASPGGVSATPNIRAGADVHLAWRVSASAHALLPTVAGTAKSGEGALDLRSILFGAGVDVTFTPPAWDLGVFAGLGTDAAALLYSGTPTGVSSRLRPNRGVAWTAAPGADAGLRYRLGRWFGLRVDESLFVLAPEPVLRIAGAAVATFGRPLSVTTAGLEVTP